MGPDVPPPPDWLDAGQRAEWLRVAPIAARAGFFDWVLAPLALELLCRRLADLRILRAGRDKARATPLQRLDYYAEFVALVRQAEADIAADCERYGFPSLLEPDPSSGPEAA